MTKKKSISKKIGILGGTFDPPHKGHLKISLFSLKKLKLDFLIWAITKKNPYKKKPMIPLKKRILISKKITKKSKKIQVNSYDKLLRSSNTINLVTYLKKRNKNCELFFLMGSDNLINFHKWKNWRKISKLSKIVVLPRPGYVKKSLICKSARTLQKKQLTFIKSEMINISSSKIRESYLKSRNR